MTVFAITRVYCIVLVASIIINSNFWKWDLFLVFIVFISCFSKLVASLHVITYTGEPEIMKSSVQ